MQLHHVFKHGASLVIVSDTKDNPFLRPKTTINGDNLANIYLPSEHPLGKDGLSENSFKGGDNLLGQAALAGKISHNLSHVLTI